MMIVIGLLGLFFVTVSYMNRDVRIDQTRAERLANTIYDQIRTARNNTTIGRGVSSGGTLVVANERTLVITPTGITTNYSYNQTSTGMETQISAPFFDGDPLYAISDISVSSGSLAALDMTGITSATITMSPNSSMIISAIKGGAIVSSPIRTLRLTATYGNFSRYISIDRVTGIAEVLRLVETGSTSGVAMMSGADCTFNGITVLHGGPGVTAWSSPSVIFGGTCSSQVRTCTNAELSGSYGYSACSTLLPSVTFDGNGGTGHTPTTKSVTSGTAVGTLPTNPTLTGYTFAGWYDTAATTGGTQITVSTIVNSNITYYARWTAIPICTQAGSTYTACTATGQTYTASTTYPGCDTPDKAVCTCIGRATIWSMCNVGTSTAGTGPASYGSMFQWGRNHPFPSSGTVPTLAGPIALSGLAAADSANQFITNNTSPYDWLTPQDENRWGASTSPDTITWTSASPASRTFMRGPCAADYHVPTYFEAYSTIQTGLGGNISNFNTALMPPLSGYRNGSDGSLYYQGSDGYWWLSSPNSVYGRCVYWNSSVVYSNYNTFRLYGFTVRCMQN